MRCGHMRIRFPAACSESGGMVAFLSRAADEIAEQYSQDEERLAVLEVVFRGHILAPAVTRAQTRNKNLPAM